VPSPHFVIESWTKEHDSSQFTSDSASLKKYIQEQAHRDVSSFTSTVFVLTERDDTLIRGYYSLSSISIVFNNLPTNVKKKLPRYPEASGILLGRLGVDRDYSRALEKRFGTKPRLGELLMTDAQIRCLRKTKDVGSALVVVDAERVSLEEQRNGARDPLPFYERYGFVALSANPRRLIKTMRAIAKEFESV